MSRSHFAGVPRGRQTLEELIEIGIPMRVHAKRLTGSDPGELVLNGPDLVEESVPTLYRNKQVRHGGLPRQGYSRSLLERSRTHDL